MLYKLDAEVLSNRFGQIGKCGLGVTAEKGRASPVVEVARLSALSLRCTTHRQLSQHPHIMHV